MSITTELFMKEIHQIIAESAEWAIQHVGLDSDMRSPSLVSDEDRATLHRITLNDQARGALKRLLTEIGRSVAYGIFPTIDGAAEREGLELPHLALVERDTGKDLSEGFLHDEFYEYAPQ